MKSTSISQLTAAPLKRKAEEESKDLKKIKSAVTKDTWVYKGKEFKMVEGAMPSSIASAFTKPQNQSSSTAPYDYDRSKLSVYCISSVKGPEFAARIELVKGPFLADVTSEKGSFKINFYGSDKEVIPLSSTEFLKAVHAAKLDLYMDNEGSETEGR
jgi:hypothetical protein